MPIRSLLPATIAALLCISLPASGQVHTPDGASKTGTVAPASVRVSWLDPKTGAFKEYRTKTPDSGPHGLAADKDGNIWFAASFQGDIGKLAPKTGTITECWREQSNRRGLLRLIPSLDDHDR